MSFSGEMPPRMHELRMSFLWRIGAGDCHEDAKAQRNTKDYCGYYGHKCTNNVLFWFVSPRINYNGLSLFSISFLLAISQAV